MIPPKLWGVQKVIEYMAKEKKHLAKMRSSDSNDSKDNRTGKSDGYNLIKNNSQHQLPPVSSSSSMERNRNSTGIAKADAISKEDNNTEMNIDEALDVLKEAHPDLEHLLVHFNDNNNTAQSQNVAQMEAIPVAPAVPEATPVASVLASTAATTPNPQSQQQPLSPQQLVPQSAQPAMQNLPFGMPFFGMPTDPQQQLLMFMQFQQFMQMSGMSQNMPSMQDMSQMPPMPPMPNIQDAYDARNATNASNVLPDDDAASSHHRTCSSNYRTVINSINSINGT
ncbi:hypothetical protein GQ42DRAFT_152659 [Ramicandelaber brevisporus]|nr:hypothetical protein GQ42DRAFT_152659 [Ramicandelaber brevisporus]